MMSILFSHAWVFWITLGGLLLAAEMLGASGYLLWTGVAAVLTGLAVWLVPFGWVGQAICFALLTLLTAFLWWRWLSTRQQSPPGEALNQRGHQLVGRHFRLEQPLVNGRGHLKVADSSWPVMAESDLPALTEVVVTGVEGITLKIRAV